MEGQIMDSSKSGCSHHKRGCLAWIMIIFGLIFLGGALGWWGYETVDILWPILVIIAGLMKLVAHKCKCC